MNPDPNPNYEDPEFPNRKHLTIGTEQWEVAGVWYTTDYSGTTRTDKIAIRPIPPTTYSKPTREMPPADLRAAILNGHF